MKRTALFGLGAALVAAIAGITLLRQNEATPTDFIYLLDARHDASGPLEQSLPIVKQLEKSYRAKVLVRTAVSLSQLRDYQAMFEEFDRTREAIPSLPMFFALAIPFRDTKKRLRSAIDERTQIQGKDRVRLLERLVVVRDTEKLGESDECKQLGDDIAYATWNFLGIGLLVHDGTIPELKKCIDKLAPAK